MIQSCLVNSGSCSVHESDGTGGLNVGDKYIQAEVFWSALSFEQPHAYGTFHEYHKNRFYRNQP